MERFANNLRTTVNQIGGINNSSNPVTFTVADATGFPSSGNFRIIIDSEIMLVTSVSGNNFTATRAQEGTVIAKHDHTAPVYHLFTAGALTAACSDTVQSGQYAQLPASPERGRLYVPNNDQDWQVGQASGWMPVGPMIKMTYPDNSLYSWVNQGSTTITQNGHHIIMTGDNHTFGTRYARMKTALTPPFRYTLIFTANVENIFTRNSACGIIQRESSTGKCITIEQSYGVNFLRFGVLYFNTVTSFNSMLYGWTDYPHPKFMRFLQVHDDGTNVNYNLSYDGIFYETIYSRGRTTLITADQIGFELGETVDGLNKMIVWSIEEG
jgi:hypothetical protein